MAKKFSELRNKMSPDAREKSAQLAKAMLAEMPLQELRQARQYSQEQMAMALQCKQASISKMERRTDMYIKTLRSYIKAMGGELVISAKFADGEIKINQFQEISETPDPETTELDKMHDVRGEQ